MALKKKDKLFVQLVCISLNLKESANHFSEFVFNEISDPETFAEKMKEYESIGDQLVHDLIIDLNSVFVTPIEREDLLSLSLSMDTILDGLNHTSALFEMYHEIEKNDYMLRFVDAIKKCIDEIHLGVELLSNKKLLNIREHILKIKELESNCDNILRESIKQLFAFEKNLIKIIQYKEIYENLEEIADACKSAANMFDTIIMKNS
ncbi:DUF47 domain-containing protein [Neobacillus cucumis]|uniref:DUF47 domain-containing protein n=1 Tax=Neobacillus cucumis TaxID=1740721 RepID=A0A2N5HVR1_9BACI|nr:DUF47 family protein [Neobacillus cucumis]PLS09597.1 DUF47 domain-containing protein [Neobacillus cucumis]